jgi:hypothetical protein
MLEVGGRRVLEEAGVLWRMVGRMVGGMYPLMMMALMKVRRRVSLIYSLNRRIPCYALSWKVGVGRG